MQPEYIRKIFLEERYWKAKSDFYKNVLNMFRTPRVCSPLASKSNSVSLLRLYKYIMRDWKIVLPENDNKFTSMAEMEKFIKTKYDEWIPFLQNLERKSCYLPSFC